MKNGGVLTIKARLNVGGDSEKSVVVQVEDTGTGISEEILGKIFDPFFTTRSSSGGSGIGLSVVKNIMELHKGSIIIKNKEDCCGACAILTFKA